MIQGQERGNRWNKVTSSERFVLAHISIHCCCLLLGEVGLMAQRASEESLVADRKHWPLEAENENLIYIYMHTVYVIIYLIVYLKDLTWCL